MPIRPLRRRVLGALAALLALAPGLEAQTVPARGTDATFEVASWNLEFFGESSQGPSDAVQLANVTAVIEQAEIDLWMLQEVVDTDEWGQLLAAVQDDGYNGLLGPSVSSNPTFDQKLAFLYDRSVVQIIGSRTILESESYEFGFRDPFEIQARVSVAGQARTVRIIVFHAKAGTGSEDYARRAAGAQALKAYIDDRVARGEEVVLGGDVNDFLLRSTRAGQLSPYKPFLDDDEYVAATLPVEQAGLPTFCQNASCTSGSARDHIFFTSGLADVYVEGSGDRYIELVSALPNYTASTSDHLPVIAAFAFGSTDVAADPEAGPVALLAPAPSPFREGTALRFRLDAAADVRLDVFDMTGRRVASLAGPFAAGAHAVPLDGRGLAPGPYVVRLAASGEVRTRVLVRAE